MQNAISFNLELLGLFSHLLLSVSHQEKTFYLGLQKIDIKPGQCVISQKKISEKFGVSRSKLGRMLKVLQSEGIVNIKGHTKYTYITVLNRHKYQSSEHQTDIKGTSNGHQTDTIKNNKKEKKDNNKNDWDGEIGTLIKRWSAINTVIPDQKNQVQEPRKITKAIKDLYKKHRKDYQIEDFKYAVERLGEVLRKKKPGGSGYGKKRGLHDFLKNGYGFTTYVNK